MFFLGKDGIYERVLKIKPNEKSNKLKLNNRYEFEDSLDLEEHTNKKHVFSEVDIFLKHHKYHEAFCRAKNNNSLEDVFKVLNFTKDKNGIKTFFAHKENEFIEDFLCFVIDTFYIIEFQQIL
ncbi:hypothetical protein EHP00_2193 [Ecytonucleospora hepatopenaei]|uniref:Uncharacterized protein n=1 Tax=Ecytonucleospora hepatopenaei TaxID=646526 RepID=A0A1W0E773_9MICR|nr:hypothetical protein EHP00_2193 [Ecytonucleospora hepatopenaei]